MATLGDKRFCMYKLNSKLIIVSFVVIVVGHAHSANKRISDNNLLAPDVIQHIRAILSLPEQQIDLARTKLTIDQFIDPSIDIDDTLKAIEAMVTEVAIALPEHMTDMDRMLSLRAYLYEKGVWNNFQPFQYDLNDPLGTDIKNKLLPYYLASKKGNCISMPFLFIILGDRLGLDVTAAITPLHVFVKFTDPETGNTFNLESTDGAGIAEDTFYYKKSPMTKQAIRNGVYMNPLSKKETVAVMAIVLSEYYEKAQEWEKSIAIADLVLEHYPNYVYAMIKKGNAYFGLLNKHLRSYSSFDEISPVQEQYFDKLSTENKRWFANAEALGWREQAQEYHEQYLHSVNQRIQKLDQP